MIDIKKEAETINKTEEEEEAVVVVEENKKGQEQEQAKTEGKTPPFLFLFLLFENTQRNLLDFPKRLGRLRDSVHSNALVETE